MQKETTVVDLPKRIITRLNNVKDEVRQILQASILSESVLSISLSFRFSHYADSDIFSDLERAQSICFIVKYENLPELTNLNFVSSEEGQHYFGNINHIRHVINEFRPIVQNQRDSIYYNNVHSFLRSRLVNRDPTSGLVITVLDENENDVSQDFLTHLNAKRKNIQRVLERSEFSYIYNGILQHSEPSYSSRFLQDYQTGELNYIFLKHAYLLKIIKRELYWHYSTINFLTFPKMGPL